MKYKIIDLFSGAGGLTLGFTDQRFCGGFECIFGIDNDKAAIDTHNENFGKHSLCTNIEDWLAKKSAIPKADIVIGGPPCQGFSLLNKNRHGDERRVLWEPFLDIVEGSNASVFVIENVDGLFKSMEFYDIRTRAEKMGFKISSDILNSANYGAPQIRRRTIIVGWKKNKFIYPMSFPPKATHSPSTANDTLPNWLTVQDAISDLPEPVSTEIRQCPAPLNLHFGRNPTQVSLQRYKSVPPGGNRFDLQKNAPNIKRSCRNISYLII